MKRTFSLIRSTASLNHSVVRIWKIFRYGQILFFKLYLLKKIGLLIQEIISAAVANVLKDSPELNYLRVINGYKRFDPTRGMDYIIDLLFADSVKGKITLRYCVKVVFKQRMLQQISRFTEWRHVGPSRISIQFLCPMSLKVQWSTLSLFYEKRMKSLRQKSSSTRMPKI